MSQHYIVWLKFSPAAAHKCGELPNVWVEQGDGSMSKRTAARVTKELGQSFRGVQAKMLPLHTCPMLLCIGSHEAKPIPTLEKASQLWKEYRDKNSIPEDAVLKVMVRDAETRVPLATITHDGRCWTPGIAHFAELPLAGVPTLADEQRTAEESA